MVRDNKGRFTNGNGGGPGRPKKSREERYLEILKTTVTYDDWQAIILRAVSDAKKGDTAARTWLSNYIVGTPQQKVDVTSGGMPMSVTLNWGDNADNENNNA